MATLRVARPNIGATHLLQPLSVSCPNKVQAYGLVFLPVARPNTAKAAGRIDVACPNIADTSNTFRWALPNRALAQGSIGMSRPNIANGWQSLEVSCPNRALPTAQIRVSCPNIADQSNALRISRPNRTQPGSILEVECPNLAEAGEAGAASPTVVVPVGPDAGEPYNPEDPGEVPGMPWPTLVTALYRPFVRVSGPVTGKISEASVTIKVNGGWTASLTFLGLHDIDFLEETTFTIELNDGAGGRLRTPPMVAEKREKKESLTGGPTTVITLVDQTSWRLSRGGTSLPTFVRVDSTAIAAAIAAEWQVQIAGLQGFGVLEEDVKDSDGWAPLMRLAAVAAQNVIVTNGGILRFIENNHSAGSVSMRCTDVAEVLTPSLSYTGFQAVKTSTLAPGGSQLYTFTQAGFASFALKSPLRSIAARDRSVVGNCGLLALWSGPPDAPDSKLVGFHFLAAGVVAGSEPIFQGLVATHATIVIYPARPGNTRSIDARLELFGSSPEPDFAGVEPAFVVNHGTGRRLTTWREQLLPSTSFVQARIARYLWEASKGSRGLVFSGRMDLRMMPTIGLLRSGYGSNRTEEVTHLISSGNVPTTSAKAVFL